MLLMVFLVWVHGVVRALRVVGANVVWREAGALRDHVEVLTGGASEYLWVCLLELSEDFLTVLDLHQGGRQGLDHCQDLPPQRLVADHHQGLLQHVVSKLVVNQALHNKVDSCLQILWLFSVVTKFLHDLLIILWESSFKYFIDMLFLFFAFVNFWVQAFFNNIWREFELRQPDEVFGDLFEYLLILVFVFEFKHVLDQVVAVGVFDQIVHVLNDMIG